VELARDALTSSSLPIARRAAGTSDSGKGAGIMLSEQQPAAIGEHPRLDWLLDNWVRYQYAGGTKHLGCKTQRMWPSGSSDFDTMLIAIDLKAAIVVDALVWDLAIPERTAVLHKHTGSVWRLHRVDMDAAYSLARLHVSQGLIRRHIP
jgi:hypothetical protein